MRLCDALGISSGDIVAFVGAGGKSSSIRETARELASANLRVVCCATTKMTASQADSIGRTFISEDVGELVSTVQREVSAGEPMVVGTARISHDRIDGVPITIFQDLRRSADVVLVEADGARGKLVKGTAEYEPVIPEGTNLTVAVASIAALGRPVTEDFVHRPEIFSVQTGVGPGQSITARAIARSVRDGSLAELPKGSHSAVLLTGVTPGPSMSDAAIIARELWLFGIKKVVLTSLTLPEETRVWMP